MEPRHWVVIARILRPRGNKGEVAAEILTDFPERLTELREVFLVDREEKNEPLKTVVESCWLSQNHRGQAVFHFQGCASISEAEKFRGMNVLLPLEQRVTLPAGHYFVSELVGSSVFEWAPEARLLSSSPCSQGLAPALLGVVSDVEFPGEGTPILVVETSSGELLIPLAEDICKRVDTGARRIEVILPEGLRDLNQK